jgi:conserved oligomeric Golgi complex subunit 6
MCRWVRGQCVELAEADTGDVHPLLPRATAALRGRPVLLRYCADEVATARHSALFHAFLLALTQGGPGGVPKPIEMQTHNPTCGPGPLPGPWPLTASLPRAPHRS